MLDKYLESSEPQVIIPSSYIANSMNKKSTFDSIYTEEGVATPDKPVTNENFGD